MNNKYGITLTVQDIGPVNEKGLRAKALIDNKGYLCGIYASTKQAEAAIPKIIKNMVSDLNRKSRKLNK